MDTCHCLSEKDVDGLIRRVVKNGFARKWDLERLQRNDGEVPAQSEEESENLITVNARSFSFCSGCRHLMIFAWSSTGPIQHSEVTTSH